ncbi:MAG: translation initiation factor IF-3, partial [SAR86 cluster bacterium]|nr:translation initiation factor IF-3 [SAR86 cluster bacterium]
MPINEKIKADKIRLIGETGEQLGIVSLSEALKTAEQQSLDLVQMAKDGNPLVCRIMNHGKHLFESKKQKTASRKKQKRIQVKEIKFRPVT